MNAASWLAAAGTVCCVLALRGLFPTKEEVPLPFPELARTQRWAWALSWHLARRLEGLLGWRTRERLARLNLMAGLPAQLPAGWLPARMALGGGVGLIAGGLVIGLMPSGISRAALAAGITFAALISASLPILALRGKVCANRRSIALDLPFLLDVMTLCLEAGQGMTQAMYLAARYCPPGPLTRALSLALNEVRAGRSQREALEALATKLDVDGVHAWVAALVQAERLGSGTGAMLRSLASQLREEAFQRAEEAAMRAPVKMLLPLVSCMFPCTFLILGFPLFMGVLPQDAM
ncbi:type II secretion system F family protein [Bordetella holmesii]|nr:type II secretion system F family protein [Bordetella holmesii]AIT27820.1 type II secretion system (T2SS), F family protein [Bordetella holmesii 44057]EWM43276.1 type II secretion system (T2SS), F family protein [Bordetella holmesii 41130]KAK83892.1 type II secretion system protein F [Bordetella holmesii CDC-H809-BH]KAK90299.1 type II secretion system protein F [Bordetella holmesii H620]KAK98544.1 type II secretion system protein F [Bordetella holmesii CDC-H635-BH]